MEPNKLSYRAEIDGLRAVAVISVILYHAKFLFWGRDWFHGGYIGVDVFFVISGYLITRIILNELSVKGSFSFLNFYERRARRILPMLLVVLSLSLPVGLSLLTPSDLTELAQSIIASLSFCSNFFFFFNTTEYGADSALLKPLLHTWSLAVEEQFYLVFPILAIFAVRYFKHKFTRVLWTIILISLVCSEVMEQFDPEFNFFNPLSRLWEMAVGSVLAHRELKGETLKEAKFSEIGSFTGLLLILVSILFFDGNTPHPSIYTLIPVTGVFLIIETTKKDGRVHRLLSQKPLVGLGLISYSAYLWHFPVMAFWRSVMKESQILLTDRIGWIVISLLLAWISYQLIEKPFRDKFWIGTKRFTLFCIIWTIGLVAVSTVTIVYDGFRDRVPYFIQRESYDDRFANIDLFKRCHRLKGADAVAKNEFCTLGTGTKNFYLVGDSHMVAIAFKLLEEIERQDGRLILMTRSGAILGKKKNVDRARLNILNTITNSTVIFGGYAHRMEQKFFDKNKALYVELFTKLKNNGNKIILIYPIPEIDVGRRSFLFEYKLHGRLAPKNVSVEDYKLASKAAFTFYDNLGGDEIIRVYPHKFLCDGLLCHGVKDGEILISDVDHPSSKTAKWIVDQVFEGLEHPK